MEIFPRNAAGLFGSIQMQSPSFLEQCEEFRSIEISSDRNLMARLASLRGFLDDTGHMLSVLRDGKHAVARNVTRLGDRGEYGTASLPVCLCQLGGKRRLSDVEIVRIRDHAGIVADPAFYLQKGMPRTHHPLLADERDIRLRRSYRFKLFFLPFALKNRLELYLAVKIVLENLFSARRDNHDVGNSRIHEFIHDKLDRRNVNQGNHFLGDSLGDRQKTGAVPGCYDYSFHDSECSIDRAVAQIGLDVSSSVHDNTHMGKLRGYLLRYACAFFFIMIFFPLQITAEEGKATVLILHSYDREYRWTEDINTGIIKAFENLKTPYLICTEYLDWKRFPNEKNIANLHTLFAEKYKNVPVDVIITSDDKALAFAAKYRKELFSDAPIVHSGVYPESVQALTGGAGNITGVYEEQDIRTTVEFALHVQPNPRAAYIISDLNESGQAVEAHLRTTVHKLAPDIGIDTLSQLPIESIEHFVAALTKYDLVFIGSYSIDKSGKTYTGETLIGRVGMASKTPVYILNTHHLGTGAFGGNLLSPYLMGMNTGGLAIKILEGTKADSIAPLSASSYTPMFDNNTLKRLGIKRSALPKGAVLINREIPFYERYRSEVIAISVIFVLLTVLLFSLSINYTRKRKMVQKLSEWNEEVSRLNDSLLESEEKLRNQYEEISVIKTNLEESEERYRLSANGSNDALWDWNYATRQMHYSTRWFEMTGFSPEKENAILLENFLHPSDRGLYKQTIKAHVEDKTEQALCEIRVKIASGRYKWILLRGKAIRDSKNVVVRFAGSITDIDDRKQKEEEIENLAYFDQLTSLPNRTQALEITQKAIDTTARGQHCGLMFIDIDNFKYINDTFGHPVGDKVLVQIAKSLSSILNENINIARFGGDEFLLVVMDTNLEEMEKYGKLAIKLLSRRLEIDGRNHFLSASAGIALYPDHASNLGELFQKADAALHRAKFTGKTKFFMFDTFIQNELLKHMELESGLRNALENNELYLAYQPQISLASHKIAGLEALVRWNNPRKGNISPADFIPVAEETGQIDAIGVFVINAVVAFIKRAETVGHNDFTVSVNVSVKQLHDEDFVKKIIRILLLGDVKPARIALEITESFMIEDLDPVIERLNELKAAGFLLSLDDFGKGYSSLSYLRTLPINYIKIDKCFIDDILSRGATVPLAKTIIALSHQLGLKVVAEGVEQKEQLDYLIENECDYIQGYYYSKPGNEETVLNQLELSFN